MAKAVKKVATHHTKETEAVAPVGTITLDKSIAEKLETLQGLGKVTQDGLKIARTHILEDVEGGHVETDLEGAELADYINDEMGIK